MNYRTFTFTTVLLAAAFLRTAPAQAAIRCEDLLQLSLSAANVTSAQRVAAGKFAPANEPGRGTAAQQQPFAKLPAFCRVVLAVKPASDSDIRVEVWLPESGWNGKFQ